MEVACRNVSVSKGQFLEASHLVCVKEDDTIKEWLETSLYGELSDVLSWELVRIVCLNFGLPYCM